MATAIQGKSHSAKTVLVVDDNSALRAILRESFLSDGFARCTEAEDGMKAIAAALDCKPDLIILDLAMPVMNGFEAAPKLKALFPKTLIILFSLHANYLKSQDLSALGIDAAFSKDVALDRLLEKAHELLST